MSASALSSIAPPARSSLNSSTYTLPNQDDLCLDSGYTGHLLIDTTVNAGPADAAAHGSDDIKPSVFDANTVSETKPWWNHLIPSAPTFSTGLQGLVTPPTAHMTAEEMFAAYADPYASMRQRAVYTRIKHEDDAEMITPPGQLYQRFNYEDALFQLPSALPTYPVAEQQREVAKSQDCDTPPELIEAAVAALMTQPAPVSVSTHDASPQDWNTPMSAHFESDFYRAQGVMRSRSHTVGPYGAAAAAQQSWFPTGVSAAGSQFVSPDPFHVASHAHHQCDGDDSDVHQCQWLGCHQVLPSAAALTNHVNRQHIARRQPAHRCLWQGCNRADHVFRHRDKILIHIRLHTNDRPFECDFPGCGKHFSRADSLDAHRKVHSAEGKSWTCRAAGCTRTYFHAKSLKKHERTAHGLDLEL